MTTQRIDTRAVFTAEQLREAGVEAGTIRIVAGVEHAADLVEDADRALAAA